MPKSNAKRIKRVWWVVVTGDQNECATQAQCDWWSRMWSRHSCSRSHVGYHTHFGPLPQPLTPPSKFFLHCSWTSLGIVIQLLECLFTTWVACNLLECPFLHYLHPHSPPSSYMLSLAILGPHSSFIRFIVRLILLCNLMVSSGKSACSVSLLPILHTVMTHCSLHNLCSVFPPDLLICGKLLQVSQTSRIPASLLVSVCFPPP